MNALFGSIDGMNAWMDRKDYMYGSMDIFTESLIDGRLDGWIDQSPKFEAQKENPMRLPLDKVSFGVSWVPSKLKRASRPSLHQSQKRVNGNMLTSVTYIRWCCEGVLLCVYACWSSCWAPYGIQH